MNHRFILQAMVMSEAFGSQSFAAMPVLRYRFKMLWRNFFVFAVVDQQTPAVDLSQQLCGGIQWPDIIHTEDIGHFLTYPVVKSIR